jgi:hypothetical protein
MLVATLIAVAFAKHLEATGPVAARTIAGNGNTAAVVEYYLINSPKEARAVLNNHFEENTKPDLSSVDFEKHTIVVILRQSEFMLSSLALNSANAADELTLKYTLHYSPIHTLPTPIVYRSAYLFVVLPKTRKEVRVLVGKRDRVDRPYIWEECAKLSKSNSHEAKAIKYSSRD